MRLKNKANLEIRHAGENNLPVITHMLPYYKANSANSKYHHRVRYANNHSLFKEGISHTSVSFWCGGSGFLGGKGILSATLNSDDVLCAVCAGKAVGAGVDGHRMINSQRVMYKPRDIK